ncbi:hypothetical protein [Petroclostridium sp. X23]|uniref:hypothetical protein n=1 Tax=Petroclostridium sp. X23 TaxID=3045146 RepID=UPI0024AD980D|nr:hypothetical protein [Petroclostridium sp. X23]WHH59092.1 hypothetical protein QKW49_25455 [Petroclostridium sp. X23]
MNIEYRIPFSGKKLAGVVSFLKSSGLDYDDGIEFTIVVTEDDKIVATGSGERNILKCIAVSEEYQSEGYSSITSLLDEYSDGKTPKCFLNTCPK